MVYCYDDVDTANFGVTFHYSYTHVQSRILLDDIQWVHYADMDMLVCPQHRVVQTDSATQRTAITGLPQRLR